jgi:hypothetical protein
VAACEKRANINSENAAMRLARKAVAYIGASGSASRKHQLSYLVMAGGVSENIGLAKSGWPSAYRKPIRESRGVMSVMAQRRHQPAKRNVINICRKLSNLQWPYVAIIIRQYQSAYLNYGNVWQWRMSVKYGGVSWRLWRQCNGWLLA